ncbi:hypothetical protein IRZ59_11745 [Pseudomonas guariconensis]|nr:hypothetical protein [Pseudomonas guariconensis]MBF8731114.1 hypothetical protein [Pseudomonas guariconensis]
MSDLLSKSTCSLVPTETREMPGLRLRTTTLGYMAKDVGEIKPTLH